MILIVYAAGAQYKPRRGYVIVGTEMEVWVVTFCEHTLRELEFPCMRKAMLRA